MRSEIFFRTNERSEEVTASAHSPKSERDAFKSGIGAEPVFRLHSRNKSFEFGGKPFGVAIQNAVSFGNETIERLNGILFPISCEEVIKKDIDDDARETTAFGREELFGMEKGGMAVCELIDGAVEFNSLNDFYGKSGKKAVGSPSDKVAQQCPDTGGVGVTGEMKMGEEVQSL